MGNRIIYQIARYSSAICWIAFSFAAYCFVDQLLFHNAVNPVAILMICSFAPLLYGLHVLRGRMAVDAGIDFELSIRTSWVQHLIAFSIALIVAIPWFNANLLVYRFMYSNDKIYALVMMTALFAIIYSSGLLIARITWITKSIAGKS